MRQQQSTKIVGHKVILEHGYWQKITERQILFDPGRDRVHGTNVNVLTRQAMHVNILTRMCQLVNIKQVIS